MAKGCQQGAKVNTPTHNKSLPKLVPMKMMKHMIIYVSLNGKTMQHLSFEFFARSEREQEMYNKYIQSETNIFPQINENQCQINAHKSDATNIATNKQWRPKGN